jgi:hypothetical protein
VTIDQSVLASAIGDEMDYFTLDWGRRWTVRALGRNPLVRFSDRVEAVVLVLVFVTALAVIPVAGTIGTAVYESRARLYGEQVRTRHTVAATAIEDSDADADVAGRHRCHVRRSRSMAHRYGRCCRTVDVSALVDNPSPLPRLGT